MKLVSSRVSDRYRIVKTTPKSGHKGCVVI